MASRRRPNQEPPTPAARSASRRPSIALAAQGVPTVDEIEARLALDDHTAALELARARLRAIPGDAKARGIAKRCEKTLTEMYLSRIGDLSQQVHLSMSGSELQWLSIDHRAGFLVSRIDGLLTVEELLEICGMARLDALRILHDLLGQKVITLRGGG